MEQSSTTGCIRQTACELGTYALVLAIVAYIVTGSLASEITGPSSTWIALRGQIEERQKSVKSLDVRFEERVVDTTRPPKMSDDPDDVHRWIVQVKGDRQNRVEEEGELTSLMDNKPYLEKRIVVSDGLAHKSYRPKFGNYYPAGFVDKKNETHLYSHVALLPIAVRYRMLEWLAAECPGLSDDQVSIRTGTIDGKACVIASWTFRGFEREVYLDRKRDLVPLRVKKTVTNPKMIQTQLQWDIQYSGKDSGYLLDGWKDVQFDGQGHAVYARTVRVIQCKVNPHIADSSFRIAFPVGTYIQDYVARENYILKENSRKRHVSTEEWESGATYESLLHSDSKVEDRASR